MITGKQLRDAVISGANSILKNRKYVDDLNIFPVPDGDTGTNMSMTIGAGSEAMEALGDGETTAAVAKAAASAMLRGARGPLIGFPSRGAFSAASSGIHLSGQSLRSEALTPNGSPAEHDTVFITVANRTPPGRFEGRRIR